MLKEFLWTSWAILLLGAAACTEEQPLDDPGAATEATIAVPTNEPQESVQETASPAAQPQTSQSPTATPTDTIATQTPSTKPTTSDKPESMEPFQDTACANFGVPDSSDFRCGYYSVPANRQEPGSANIRLAVMIAVADKSDRQSDPVVYLAGGPGENAIESMQFVFLRHFAAFTSDRDLIVVDQRGTGFSEPALDCPELLDLRNETAGMRLEPDEALALTAKSFADCRDRLKDLGVNLGDYTSKASATDVRELMVELGYSQWNLYGISYGTRLALTIMRDHPEGVRSVILDSTYPLQVDLYTSAPANLDRALTVLFEGCSLSPECEDVYPDLKAVLFETASELNAEPVNLLITNPFTGQKLEPLFHGNDLLGFVYQSLYDTDIIPSLPKIIYDIKDRRMGTVELILSSRLIADELVSVGLQLSVQCGEEVPFTSAQSIQASAENVPDLTGMFQETATLGRSVVQICDDWGVASADLLENRPVFSDIPTMIIAGAYDPITPPSWGELVEEDLPNSMMFNFAASGHGASIDNACALNLILQFLANPLVAIDDSCQAATTGPEFVVPVTSINLVKVTDTDFGYSALAPEGWHIIAPGTYALTELGETALLMQSIPSIGQDDLLELLVAQLNLPEPPVSHATFDGASVKWTLYQLTSQGLTVDVALSESDDSTYYVILQAAPDHRDFLLQELFEPVLEAFSPES